MSLFDLGTTGRRRARRVAAGGLIITIAAMQCYSGWDFHSDQVDESELVHYAVGFFGGDFDPRWYGYGSLGMYLLFALYAVIGYVGVLFGVFAGIDDFAQRLFSDGFFFVIGRFFFAVVGMTTVAIYALIARRSHVPRVLVAGFMLVAVVSPDAIYVANYIRPDSLVALFSAVALLGAVMSSRPLGAYIVALACAAAISSKLSALPLAAFVLAVYFYRASRREIEPRTILIAMVVFGVSLLAFQPFVDYGSVVTERVGRGVDPPIKWSRTYYGDLPSRMSAILSVLREHVGLPVLMAAPLGLLGLYRWRDLSIFAVVLWGLLITPFLASPEVTFYWFIPLFNLTRFLALMGVAALLVIIREVSFERRPTILATRTFWVFVAAVLLVPAAGDAKAFGQQAADHWNNRENRQVAETWLEEHLLGHETVVLDSSFTHVLPRVYDPRNLAEARSISRAFVFERHTNEYLGRIFHHFLWEDYARSHDLLDAVNAVKTVRLDVASRRSTELAFRDVQLCGPFDTCRASTPIRSKSVQVVPLGHGDFDLRVTDEDPYVVLFEDESLPSDGSMTLSFEQQGPPYSHGNLFLFEYGEAQPIRRVFPAVREIDIRLGRRTDDPFVRRADPEEIVRSDGRSISGTYVVTSPAIYARFLQPNAQLDEAKERRLQLLRPYYESLLEHGELIQRFDDGSGPPIEVYEMPDVNRPEAQRQ